MTGLRSYQDLDVWKLALDWVESVYRLTAHWPVEERYGLTSQTRRSAVSVAANIAEGAARRTTGEFLQFIGVAKGSLAEAETLLILAARLGHLSEAQLSELLEVSARIGRMLSGLSKSLETSH